MDFIAVVQAPAYPLGNGRFATESAFAEHLRQLRKAIGPKYSRLVLFAPRMPHADYQSKRNHLVDLSEDQDGIVFLPAHEVAESPFKFWALHAFGIWRKIYRASKNASVIHSGVADDIWRPIMAFANLAGWLRRIPVIFIVDIDFRKNTQRYYKLGLWSVKSYVVNRLFYDPLKWIQVWLAVRWCHLCLLKSVSMVRDFGRNRTNVRFFLDAAHGAENVIADETLTRRLELLQNPDTPLHVVYFGRLVDYKGLNWAVEAISIARSKGANVKLTFVGDGECREELKSQVNSLGLEGVVEFLEPVKYGEPLFSIIDQAHISIATPQVEDTPRAALDSMARGLPVIAFDIEYYQSLAEQSRAVALAKWPETSAIAAQLVELDRKRDTLAAMSKYAVEFARDNTQELWLQRRIEWMRECTGSMDTPEDPHAEHFPHA